MTQDRDESPQNDGGGEPGQGVEEGCIPLYSTCFVPLTGG